VKSDFKITYEDGTEVVVEAMPKHLLKAERVGKNKPNLDSTYYLVHLASGSDEPIDAWLEKVRNIEPINDDDELAVATRRLEAAYHESGSGADFDIWLSSLDEVQIPKGDPVLPFTNG
jgi:hypothetical protein